MSGDNLRRLGDSISVPIKSDDDGFTGRECPKDDCEGYFKIQFGTGLKGENPCHCPYCGHLGPHNTFWTKEQLEYAKSVAMNKITGALLKDFKKMEFDHRPSGAFGIGISLKVEGKPHPVRYYREKALETELVCDKCTLRYAVYGVFAFCPDCGAHNSRQILAKNLDLFEKQLTLSKTLEKDLADHLVTDALENAVSAFDGYGREVARRFASKAMNQARAETISFQSLAGARKTCTELFGLDFAAEFSAAEWKAAVTAFQKRHLFSHTMGVIDEKYVAATGDTSAVVGRKAIVTPEEVVLLIHLLRRIGEALFTGLEAKT
jgi:hypothetical protein